MRVSGPRIEVWHGPEHRVGHLGDQQDDFNVLGHVQSANPVAVLTCSVNGGVPMTLRTSQYRRLVEVGDFNADIPISSLKVGRNSISIRAIDTAGARAEVVAVVLRTKDGAYTLPARIRWESIMNPEDVGQYTDGNWTRGAQGLRTAQIGYDRVFLVGNRTWADYEATGLCAIHALAQRNGPQSGTVRHIGFCMRWAGHTRENNLPDDQPKWGLHPRGCVLFLTFLDGRFPPVRQFWPGDSEEFQTFAPFPVELDRPFWMKGRCQTLPDSPEGEGVTRYSLKLWDRDAAEPQEWDFTVTQINKSALRTGGLALVAHELDATFGDLTIVPVSP